MNVRIPRRAWAAGIVALTALLVVGSGVHVTAQGVGNEDTSWVRPPNDPKYPPVVGYINSQAIPREQLLRIEALHRMQAHAPRSAPLSDFAPGAKREIEDWTLLIQRAAQRGFACSAVEVQPAIKTVVDGLPLMSPDARAQVEASVLSSSGDRDIAQWAEDPKVIHTYQEVCAVSKMIRASAGSPAGGQDHDLNQSMSGQLGARERILSELRSQAHIQWLVP